MGFDLKEAGAARPSYTKPIHPRLNFELNCLRLVVAGACLPAVLSAVVSAVVSAVALAKAEALAKEGLPGVKTAVSKYGVRSEQRVASR